MLFFKIYASIFPSIAFTIGDNNAFFDFSMSARVAFGIPTMIEDITSMQAHIKFDDISFFS